MATSTKTQNTGICGRSRYQPTLGELTQSNQETANKTEGAIKEDALFNVAVYGYMAERYGRSMKLAACSRDAYMMAVREVQAN